MRPQWMEEVTPIYEGAGGKVYRFAEPPEELEGTDPRYQIHIPESTYLLFAPQAHPAWDWHLMITINLAEAPGVDPPKLHYQGAEFEVSVFAIDPNMDAPDPRAWPMGHTPPAIRLLHPPDTVVQFHGPTKEQVPEMMDKVAEAVSTGYLVPDSDFHNHWMGVITKTAEHYRGHPENN